MNPKRKQQKPERDIAAELQVLASRVARNPGNRALAEQHEMARAALRNDIARATYLREYAAPVSWHKLNSRTRTKPEIEPSYEQIVRVWVGAESSDEAAEELSRQVGCEISRQWLAAKVAAMRRFGVELRKLPPRSEAKKNRMPTDELNALIAELQGGAA